MNTFLLYSPLIIATVFMILGGIVIIHHVFFEKNEPKHKSQLHHKGGQSRH